MGLLGCGALLAWATALSFFDIRERRLPNALTLSGAAVLLVVAVGTGHGATALAGALARAEAFAIVPAEVDQVSVDEPVAVMLVS